MAEEEKFGCTNVCPILDILMNFFVDTCICPMPAKRKAKKRASGRRSKALSAKVREEKVFSLNSGKKVKYALGQECGLKKRSRHGRFYSFNPDKVPLTVSTDVNAWRKGCTDRQRAATAKGRKMGKVRGPKRRLPKLLFSGIPKPSNSPIY